MSGSSGRGLGLVVALAAGWCGVELRAEPPASPEAGAAAAWTKADTEIGRIEARLQEMQGEFQKATPERQGQMRTEAMGLVETIKQQFRVLGAAAPEEYPKRAAAAEPARTRAEELVRQALALAYSENRYPDAVRIAEAMLKVDPKSRVALNIGGVSHFATHDFARAVALLEQSAKEQSLIPELGGHYLDTARNYVKFWESEQQQRARDATLTGDQQLPQVRLKTSRGDILLELFEDQAPNTVANFISLVEKGFYNGSQFHRVIPNFMAQGGMPGKGIGGLDGPGYSIDCECYRPDFRRHFAGTLSMAHAGKDTGGSQFFITHLPTAHLDGEGGSESHHTVFGRVLEGLDVAAAIQQGDQIVSAEVVRKRNHPYVPATKPDR